MPKQNGKNFIAGTLFFLFSACSTFLMRGRALSDDQITYWQVSRNMAGRPFTELWKNPGYFFSVILLSADTFMKDAAKSHLLTYAVLSFLYLTAMNWFLRLYFKPKISFLLSLISIVPHYTIGMTYWGFAGFEFIKARILWMPLLPVVLRLYFEPGKKRLFAPFLLTAAGAFLSFEAVYLLGILALDTLIRMAGRDFNTRAFFKFCSACFLSLLLILAIRYAGDWVPALSSSAFTDPAGAVYQKIVPPNALQITALSPADYVALRWKAAYAGFWWALFPPKAADCLFMLFNAVFFLPFAFLGYKMIKQAEPETRQAGVRFLFLVIVTAYATQAIRFLMWKGFGAPPLILEEPRAFKYIYLPVFIFTGFYLADLYEKRRFLPLTLAFLLLMLSPLEMLRALPESAKTRVLEMSQAFFKTSEYSGYIEKALRIKVPGRDEELAAVNAILRRQAQPAVVLTDIHAVKDSGSVTLVSYQDKRIYDVEKKERYNSLPYWYLAYSEIHEALRRADAAAILNLCKKYGCSFVVSEKRLESASLGAEYAGRNLFLYSIRNLSDVR